MQTLGDLEAAVLEALWEHGELSTPDVYEAVGVPRGLAYTTILTVLQRLARKQLVTRRGGGRSHRYAPALTREAFQERRAESLAGLLVDIGSDGVGAFLAEAERLDPDVVAALRRRLRANR
jgi:predicted transcriptional regulator